MYFTKIELHNYGIYKGTHEMNLTDKTGNRNITLIGGLNGRGKTTFHDAILIALYGKQAMKYIQESARSYDKLLLDHINKHATDDKTYIALSLVMDDNTKIRICRSWKRAGKKAEQSILVEKNGQIDKYLGASWSYYIEEILPFGIARFFFFNNEKITQLADDSSFEQINASIKSAIGVTTIEKAIDHADEVIRRKKKALEAFEASAENREYQEVEQQIFDTETRIDIATKEQRALEFKCQKISAELEAAESKFWASGGDLTRNRDSIKAEMERIKAIVKEIQTEIMQMVSDAATPLSLCRELVIQSYDAEKKQISSETREYTNTILAGIHKKLIQRLDEAGLSPDILNIVKDIVHSEIPSQILITADGNRESMSNTSMMLYKRLIGDFFPTVEIKIHRLIEDIESQENEYMNLDAHLGAADEKSVAMQLFEALRSIEQEKAIADSEFQKKCDLIESLKRQREILSSKRVQLIKRMADTENTNDDNLRIVRYAAMAVEVLTDFKTRLQKEKVGKLAATATKCFQRLVEKNSLVSTIDIDSVTLNVTMIDTDGNELLKSQLSAGEQQMFAISIVWALALTSGYKAPVIIDTPMARLDSAHRANFVSKYLPEASSQVLVLSTDEEIQGHYLDLIRDNVIESYTLLYREDEQCTSIVQGYFEEA